MTPTLVFFAALAGVALLAAGAIIGVAALFEPISDILVVIGAPIAGAITAGVGVYWTIMLLVV